MHPTLASEGECTMFAAFDKISEDGKAGFYYFKLLWVDSNTPNTTNETRV